MRREDIVHVRTVNESREVSFGVGETSVLYPFLPAIHLWNRSRPHSGQHSETLKRINLSHRIDSEAFSCEVKPEPDIIIISKVRFRHYSMTYRHVTVVQWEVIHVSSVGPHVNRIVQNVYQRIPLLVEECFLNLAFENVSAFLFKDR